MHTCNNIMLMLMQFISACAGTMAADDTPPQPVYVREILPRVTARPDLWPASTNGYEAFLRAASAVQSRAFHMVAENWVTGAKQVCAGPCSICTFSVRHMAML